REPALITVAASCPTILEETALHILESWQQGEIFEALLDNKKLLEKSPGVVARLAELSRDRPEIGTRLDSLEESMLQGQTDLKVEGATLLCGIHGPINAARQGGRSGTLVVESVTGHGRIFLHRGKIIGALAGSLEGMPALEEIVNWDNTRFRYLLRTHFHVANLDPVAAEALIESGVAGPKTPAEGVGGVRSIAGSLECMDLYEALAMMEGTPFTVAMTVVCEEGSGEIVRERSRILHAHVAGKGGPHEAMAAMVAWKGLRFLVRPMVGEAPVTVDRTLNDFFTESIRLVPDELFGVPRPGELPEWELSEEESESLYHLISRMGVADKVKLAMLGNKEARAILVRDPIKMVALAAVKSPKIREDEIEGISKSRNVCEDVLRQIAATKEWMKSYTIKLNLANNSKTPIPITMRLLSQFREQDLWKMAKNKNIPAAVATQARRMAEGKSSSV
ncbi:MAG: DUF4388 domain-containing protein, partial [Deltaproteobacteria bacterium]|nr:DUF4388 domain-containing protein [Deltaproteobacteria bacterium]